MIIASQPGFFDLDLRLAQLEKTNQTLPRLAAGVNFELFRPELAKTLAQGDGSKGGRPAFDRVMLFKALVLARLWHLSDDQLEYQIADRLSFQRFLGLGLHDRVPDAKTFWHFREQLKVHELAEPLFASFLEALSRSGLVLDKEGVIIDATVVEAPGRHLTDAEQAIHRQSQSLPASTPPNRARQLDCQAGWQHKRSEHEFGYKNHVRACRKTKLVSAYAVTGAQVPDRRLLETLITPADSGKAVYGDAAYSDKAQRDYFAQHGIIGSVSRRGYRPRPMSEADLAHNARVKPIRRRIEHIFGAMATQLSGLVSRRRTLARARIEIGMLNLCYNMLRALHLQPASRFNLA